MSRTIVDYKILYHTYLDDLKQMVNDAILDGWQPLGSLATVVALETWFYQAMVRYADD